MFENLSGKYVFGIFSRFLWVYNDHFAPDLATLINLVPSNYYIHYYTAPQLSAMTQFFEALFLDSQSISTICSCL